MSPQQIVPEMKQRMLKANVQEMTTQAPIVTRDAQISFRSLEFRNGTCLHMLIRDTVTSQQVRTHD